MGIITYKFTYDEIFIEKPSLIGFGGQYADIDNDYQGNGVVTGTVKDVYLEPDGTINIILSIYGQYGNYFELEVSFEGRKTYRFPIRRGIPATGHAELNKNFILR